jgi:large subunit ribosomal protein L28
MSLTCDICGKGSQVGHKVSHSKRATNRRWVPNIQTIVVQDGETTKRINVCTRCLRTLHKSEK